MSEPVKKRGRAPKDRGLYPHVVDFRRPVGDLNSEIELCEAVAGGKTPDPNKGLMTAKQYAEAVGLIQANPDNAPPLPPAYSMVRRAVAAQFNATCLIAGQKSKAKAPRKSHGVPDKLMETFGPHDRVVTDSKGNAIALRLCHRPDARDLVENREQNVLTFGKLDYVVGTTDVPAIFLINGSKTGNYGANVSAGKELSFESMSSKVRSLVGRFNNTCRKITLDDDNDTPYVVPAYSIIDAWGHIVQEDKIMTSLQIRNAIAAGETDKMKFVPLEEPIVGAGVNRSDFWKMAKHKMALASTKRDDATALDRFESRPARGKNEKRTPADRAWSNLTTVQTRTDPVRELFPFGLRNMQTQIVPVVCYGKSTEDELVRFVIGCFTASKYRENRYDAHVRLNPEAKTTEKPKSKKLEIAKPKAESKKKSTEAKPKKKTKKKSTTPKTEKTSRDAGPSAAESVLDAEPVSEIIDTDAAAIIDDVDLPEADESADLASVEEEATSEA